MKKFKKTSILLLALVLVFSLALSGCGKKEDSKQADAAQKADTQQAVSDKSWQSVKDKGELVVGLCAEYAPFESRNEKTGQIEGFDIDIANALANELGVKVKIADAQWESLVGGVEKGDYDVLITCMSKKEAAQGNVNMSEVYYNLKEIIVVNKDNNTINSVDDLKGKVVGVQTQTSSEQAADKLSGLKEVKRYNRTPEAFIDLQNKRIDAVIVGYAYAATQMKSEVKGIKIVNSPVDSSDIVMVMKKGNDELTLKLNDELSKIKQNGKYDEAINKWLKLE
jgi:polar amino acid transport system substrate-binding protein